MYFHRLYILAEVGEVKEVKVVVKVVVVTVVEVREVVVRLAEEKVVVEAKAVVVAMLVGKFVFDSCMYNLLYH